MTTVIIRTNFTGARPIKTGNWLEAAWNQLAAEYVSMFELIHMLTQTPPVILSHCYSGNIGALLMNEITRVDDPLFHQATGNPALKSTKVFVFN